MSRSQQPKKHTVGHRLRRERERLNWTQEQLAEALGTSTFTIRRWEHDQAIPRPIFRAELCRVFGQSAEALFGLDEPSDDADEKPPQPLIWLVPHLRNLSFTGREDILAALHSGLAAHHLVALTQPRALTGLGGIGKTQIAIEYAYRYGAEYEAVLWVRADSRQALISDVVALADVLDLPEKAQADQRRVVVAVQRWLRAHRRWLLILDNADEVGLSYELFTGGSAGGAVLLTTQAQATGPNIKNIEVDTMERQEGSLLLLRRAKLLEEDVASDTTRTALEAATERDRCEAEAICALLDGLPLALDQAAAYVEENQCGFADYLQRYQSHRAAVLARRGTLSAWEYPHSVATTWALSFALVQRTDPAAAELLHLCAFLHPDAIPEEFLAIAADALGPLLHPLGADLVRLDAAIGCLRRYSLVRRNPEMGTLTIHRLVQAVLRDAMPPESQREWADRVVRAVHQAFPEPEFAAWRQCERYLSHAQVCADLIERWELAFPEAADLLRRVGTYLFERRQFREAEPFHRRAAEIAERVFGADHPEVARNLSDLALVVMNRRRYGEADHLYRRALCIQERALGPVHPDVGVTLNDLAMLALFQGHFEGVEALHLRARAIFEQTLGPTHPYVADSMNNLGKLYIAQGRFAQAEPLVRRALVIREAVQGADHPDVSNSCHQLARLCAAQGKYAEAKVHYIRALRIRRESLGEVNPDTAETLDGLARLEAAQGRWEQAEQLFKRALARREQSLGTPHPAVAETLDGYADLLRNTGRMGEAERFTARAEAMRAELMHQEPSGNQADPVESADSGVRGAT